MTTGRFWDEQHFSYIITYSFNRGPKLHNLKHASRELHQTIRQTLSTIPSKDLQARRNELNQLKHTYSLELFALTEELASFHITASPIARVERSSSVAKQLADIMHTPVFKQSAWMCAPVYRDAIAFYDERDNLLGVLNICFACDRMLTHTKQDVEADEKTYEVLRNYLAQLGHMITES